MPAPKAAVTAAVAKSLLFFLYIFFYLRFDISLLMGHSTIVFLVRKKFWVILQLSLKFSDVS